MSKNLNRTMNALISVPGQVPEGTQSGDVVLLGSDGLIGYALTDRVSQADLDDLSKVVPQGLKAGEASLELVGISLSVNLPVDGPVAQWAAVYRAPDGTYTGDAPSGTKIGYALETYTGTGYCKVGLSAS